MKTPSREKKIKPSTIHKEVVNPYPFLVPFKSLKIVNIFIALDCFRFFRTKIRKNVVWTENINEMVK